jgi:hypothetical protein
MRLMKQELQGALFIRYEKATPTIPISVVGDLCFGACFSQLEPKPPSGGRQKKKSNTRPLREGTQKVI